ncbi:Hypothetical predicted protein [Paramuricea clavata]|nr:Hypothetical predicted protein [Paramuricea clavata]
MAYDAISLQRVTLNGKNEIRLIRIPTTKRKTATVLSVPYNGCPLPNGRLLKVGEQYTNYQCTRLCTCNEEGLVPCIELCPTRPISVCNAPLVRKKILVPTDPPDSKCTCQQVICVKAETTTDTSETIIPLGAKIPSQEGLPVKSYKAVKCCCGKVCKGARGLKMHQRSCRVIDDLEDELQQQMSEVLNEHQNEDNVDSVNPEISHINTQENFPDLKKGIKLPKSPLQWSTANDFFKLTFSNLPITPRDLNNNINTMATVVYNYFSENFGYVNNHNDVQYQRKYESFSTKDLKNSLKKLKLENGDILEIKFVAKKLRNLLNKSNITDPNNTDSHASANIDHDSLIGLILQTQITLIVMRLQILITTV